MASKSFVIVGGYRQPREVVLLAVYRPDTDSGLLSARSESKHRGCSNAWN